MIKLIILLMIFSSQSLAQNACPNQMTKKSKAILWKEFPIQMQIEENVPEEYEQAIKEAAAVWNHRFGFEAIEIKVKRIKSEMNSNKPDGKNIIYWSDDESYLPENTQAKTATWSNHQATLIEADISIAFLNFNFSTTGEAGMVDMKSLMIHEFGHVLGINHIHSNYSVMNAELGSGEIRHNISKLDLDTIGCIYMGRQVAVKE